MTDLNVLLFVELPDATPWQCQELAKELSNHNWNPMKNVGWFSSRFECCDGDADVLGATDDLLRLIADVLHFPDLNAVCLISEPPAAPRQGYFIDSTDVDDSATDTARLSNSTDTLC